ncbi:MAG TPA: hypothetical protein VMM18_17235 [Gemmatimonadaceae bacterium]|nr:hypothetical protein [Gemmatimonadaceae bacterium]
MDRSFEKQYDEERYLFDSVGPRFRQEGSLGAYDLFAIVRWKANRAITRVALRISHVADGDLETAARELTRDLASAHSPRERFVLMSEKWGLRLPMASAILAVLYPEQFTVYDIRVCSALNAFHGIGNLSKPDVRWGRYQEYITAVNRAAPASLSLRDKDRWLWARSRHQDLERLIARDFRKHPQGNAKRTSNPARKPRTLR